MHNIETGFELRRLSWVHVLVDGRSTHAELHGIGHRRPIAVRVPMSAAVTLAAGGLPVFVERVAHPAPAGG